MERNAIGLIVTALALREAWTLLPLSYGTFDPFPYFDIQITPQTYVYFLCHYASMMIFAYAFTFVIKSFHEVLKAWFILQTVEFIDYLLTYNNPWFHFLSIGVGITIIKFIVLSFFVIKNLEWKK